MSRCRRGWTTVIACLLTGCADHVSEVIRGATPAAIEPTIDCPILPAVSPWNQDISAAAVDPLSATYIARMGANLPLVAHFGTDATNGIPYVVVPQDQALVPIAFVKDMESDPGPYPIPPDVPIEQGVDGHALIIQNGSCLLYEIYQLGPMPGAWQAYAGALWHLREDMRRPLYFTSADGAGLPIFPGLVRYDEIATGEIQHALRFGVTSTQHGFVDPATHWASVDPDPTLPPMGLRLRLKASVDTSTLPGAARVIAVALQRYGMFVAENRDPWSLSGVSDPRFSAAELLALQSLFGDSFEAIVSGPITTQ